MKYIFWIILVVVCCIGWPAEVFAGEAAGKETKVVLFPVQQAVLSAGIDGKVQIVKVREGESFSQQALLAQMDDRPLRQAEIIARQGLQESRSQLRFAQEECRRLEELHQRSMTGDHELAVARLQLETAEAKTKTMEAELYLAGYRLEQCRVVAPFAGRLVKIHTREHEYVRPGQPLLEIIDDRHLLAVMHVDSNELVRIRPEMKIHIRIEETGEELVGTLYSQGAAVDPGSRSFEMKILIDNAGQKLRAGMSGAVTSWVVNGS